jgi:hypothetical protein
MGKGKRLTLTADFPDGGFRFAIGVPQYSCGVIALPGLRIRRVRFRRTVPLVEGFARIAAIIQAAGRPLTSFCACELRSPAPFSEAGFSAFNGQYQEVLTAWGLMRDGINPVARSNVCPELDPPAEPGFHAFSFTVAEPSSAPSFVVAGSGEVPEGRPTYRDHIVAPGDTGPDGMRAKIGFVLGEMQRRMSLLGVGWADANVAQIYTLYDIHPFIPTEIAGSGAMGCDLVWHYCRPPIVGLDYEMDCRGLVDETVL